ncbi:hypothetical protein KNE206_51080 [Kitasatospora sp. NE20-6]|uniref:FxSxx-COOH system tetratricopeptide repeat protein n=1 Tax=Kitasatospora sp. NE20-6 TaxID=2859066 RepID=UPI0034DC7B9D
MRHPEEQPASDYWVTSHGSRGTAAQSIGMVVNGDVVMSPGDPQHAPQRTPQHAPQRTPQHAPQGAPQGTGPELPGGTPMHWSVPPRNVSFTGRAEVLSELHARLAEGTTAVVAAPHTLYGLGGVGKTQLALEYAHRYKAYYDLVWWIDAEQTELIPVALARLARQIGLPVEADTDTAAVLKDALRRGVPTSRWLLVFDNADTPAAVHDILPSGPGHTLITSRNPNWSGLAEVLPVGVFTREESIGHVCRRVRGLARADADRVADAVGDLPLAVEIAAAWLATSGMPVRSYVAQLYAGASRALGADPMQRFDATWQVSVSLLREQVPAAVGLLELCAFFAPEPISLDLFYSEQMLAALAGYDDSLTDVFMLGRVLQAVGRYALVHVDPGSNSFQMHRLVQAVIRSGMDTTAQQEALHSVHRILVGARPPDGDTDSPANWPHFNTIWPHLAPSYASDCDEPETRELLIDRVRHLRSFSSLERAGQLAEQITASWSARLGEEDEGGRDWQVLRRQLFTLSFHHANVLRSQGRYADAHAMDETTHAGQRALLGERHPQTLMTAASLAADLRALGRLQEALRLRQRTFRSFREVLGPADPRTLAIAGTVARDLREIGDYPGAVELLRDVTGETAGILRPDHPEDLRIATSLAVSLRRNGQLQEALELAGRTYERHRDRYGPDAADTLACALGLAADHSASGDKETARELATAVHEGYRRLLGHGHVFTRICENNLGIYLRGCGDPEGAVRLGSQAVEGLRSTLGPDHQYTLNAMVNLANAHGEAGRTADARALEQAAHAGLTSRYGPGHPDTVTCGSNLAVTLRRTDPARAAELHEHALAGLGRLLGAEHPATVACRAWQRIDRDLEPQSV